jgi:hypothetical protein
MPWANHEKSMNENDSGKVGKKALCHKGVLYTKLWTKSMTRDKFIGTLTPEISRGIHA